MKSCGNKHLSEEKPMLLVMDWFKFANKLLTKLKIYMVRSKVLQEKMDYL